MILSESSRIQNFIISVLLVMEQRDIQMHKKGRKYLPIFLMVIAGWWPYMEKCYFFFHASMFFKIFTMSMYHFKKFFLKRENIENNQCMSLAHCSSLGFSKNVLQRGQVANMWIVNVGFVSLRSLLQLLTFFTAVWEPQTMHGQMDVAVFQ